MYLVGTFKKCVEEFCVSIYRVDDVKLAGCFIFFRVFINFKTKISGQSAKNFTCQKLLDFRVLKFFSNTPFFYTKPFSAGVYTKNVQNREPQGQYIRYQRVPLVNFGNFRQLHKKVTVLYQKRKRDYVNFV